MPKSRRNLSQTVGAAERLLRVTSVQNVYTKVICKRMIGIAPEQIFDPAYDFVGSFSSHVLVKPLIAMCHHPCFETERRCIEVVGISFCKTTHCSGIRRVQLLSVCRFVLRTSLRQSLDV